MNSGDRMKKICAMLLSLLLFVSCCVSTADAAINNPIQLTGTDAVRGLSEFVISVDVKDAWNLAAFQLTVDYDESVLEVAEGGFHYSEEFQSYYVNGVCDANNRSQSEVVFAGAKTGAGAYTGTLAVIHFRVKDSSKTATTISLQVQTLATEEGGNVIKADIVNQNINYAVILQDFNGIYGDVDFNQNIDLNDAQLTLKAALKIIALDADAAIAADVNQDGTVNLQDAQIILKKALKIIA